MFTKLVGRKLWAGIAIILILGGCAQLMLKDIEESDLIGKWESIGVIPYAKLEYYESGTGWLVTVADNLSTIIYRVDSYTSKGKEFTLRLVDIKDTENPEIVVGSIFQNQLNLKGSGDEYDGIWFAKSGRLPNYQEIADKELLLIKEKEHNKQLHEDRAKSARGL